MPQYLTTLRAVSRSGLLGKIGIKRLIKHHPNYYYYYYAGEFGNHRWLSSIVAAIDSSSSSSSRRFNPSAAAYYYQHHRDLKNINAWNVNGCFQKRWFLGCGDGEEGSAISKVHEEKLIIGYSPEQLYAVVAAVEFYEDFLPWCQRSDILRRYPDGSFDAELQIGFKFLVESYVSHVVLEKSKMIKTTASESNLFEHLINVWEFSPGPTPDTCSVYFLVDFKFKSPLYRQVASMFFKEVVSRLVSSFIDRCRLIYGPGATIEQKA